MDLTEKLDYSSAVLLLGYSLILSILRSFNVTVEAAQVMVGAPLLAFITTHILFLNFYRMDYGMNIVISNLLSLYACFYTAFPLLYPRLLFFILSFLRV